MSKSEFLKIFKERGFLHQSTDEENLDKIFNKGGVCAYIGFDCTANSLHIGSLVQIMILRWLQKLGHKPIVLLGGGTTKVGDPSGKDESRKILDKDDIANNMAGIKKSIGQFVNFGDGKNDAMLVNNDDWLKDLSYIDFLRDYGKHFSVNRMLSFDSVKLRLEREQTLSFLEFNYMLLQAYDFVELHKRYDCKVQIGGSDQWGNIVNGIELNRRLGFEEVFGLTTPLITTSSGAKMGKTANGAVWLDEQLYSPYDYWQYWRNTEDKDVGRFLRLFTELPIDEIEKLENLKDAQINEAKIILANEATKLCHGIEAANNAAETAKKTFEQGAFGDDLPTIEISKSDLDSGIALYKLLHDLGLSESGGAAKKLIKGGGGRINGQKATDPFKEVTTSDIGEDGFIKISAGKKKHALVKIV
ncbi:tyrosine--tRNA ligase [Rickettsiales bacterium]|nr:tyrosine--tRNA ligase [Rickettsiales bacterium]